MKKWEQIKEIAERNASMKQDTYVGFGGLTHDEVLYFIEQMNGEVTEEALYRTQGRSPTIREMLDYNGQYNMRYSGYAIFPPRKDYRISIDEITFKGVDKTEVERLLETI